MSETMSHRNDPALDAPSLDNQPGPDYAAETRVFQGIPGIERAANGRLWATWYGGGPTEGPDNYVMLATSADDGKTWSDLKLVIDPHGKVRAFDPCLWHDPLGRLWLFWAQAYEFWDGRAGVWAVRCENSGSEDPQWSGPRRLCNGVMMNKPTVLSSGEWLLPAAVWSVPVAIEGANYRHDLGDEKGSNVVCSTDGGETWAFWGQAEAPQRACDEHMLVERKDGSLWMLVRTEYGIADSLSFDKGRTWSKGTPSSIWHIRGARFFIRRLGSGNLLLVKHNPPGLGAPRPLSGGIRYAASSKDRSHLTAFLSDDDGLTWRGGLMLDERLGVSYPDGVQDPQGVIRVIYDFSRQGEKEILMARFTEEDVAAGSCVSAPARLAALVNKATGQPDA